MIEQSKKKSKIIYKYIYIFAIFFVFLLSSKLEAETDDKTKDALGFDKYISTIDEYVKSSDSKDVLDISSLASQLISSKKLDYNNIITKILSIFFKQIVISLKSAISIYLIIILMAIVSNMQVEEKSSISQIAFFAFYIVISTILIKNFIEILAVFKNTVTIIATTMKIVAPFLVTILIATGAATTTTIIQPLLLFLASLVNSIIEFVVIPFITISVALNIVDSLTDKIKLNRLSKLFSKSAVWIIGVVLTVFLGVLSLETNITSSVDILAVKTTQAAVSDFVPVVGKFFSDSFEAVVGATKIIGKVGGTIGIVAIIAIAAVPIIKIATTMIIYMILSALAEPICTDTKILKTLDMFAGVYKSLFGILVGVVILFVISTGIVLNLSSSIVK